ncbi:MAG: flagellin [bacterium]
MGINRINQPIGISAQRNLNTVVSTNLRKVIESLSSGLKIKRAGDDAGGFTIAKRLQAHFASLTQAMSNAQTSLNVAGTADQALDETSNRLLRMRELAVQAANTGVYDTQARQAMQAEISQNIDEINRIANTTQFGTNRLLNGDLSAQAGLRAGQPNIGVQVDTGPGASTLSTETNYLTITQTRAGSTELRAGEGLGRTQTINLGITNATDIAVTAGTFFNSTAGAAAAAGDTLTDLTFNTATLQNGGTITFQGQLADGTTGFSGTLSIGAGTTLNDIVTTVQAAIDRTETAQGINTAGGTGAGETNVNFNATTGRLEFTSGQGGVVSQLDINFTVQDAAGVQQTQTGVTREAALGGQIGNNMTAITGSTFDTGQVNITVTNVQAATNRRVESGVAFRDQAGGALNAGGNLAGAVYNGVTLAAGDTIEIAGVNADGTTFTNTITVAAPGADAGAGNAQAATFQDLIDELNVRDNAMAAGGVGNQSGFATARATLTGNGTIQVVDDLAATSQTNFTLTVNDRTPAGGGTFGTIVDNARVIAAGNAERATVRVNGGPAQQVEAGQVATLYGPTRGYGADAATPQVTLRIGSGLTAGTDVLAVQAEEYVGRLNNGPAMTFQNGDQNVTFVSGRGAGVAETLTVDFGASLDIPGVGANNARTVVISATNRNANFQVGAFEGQDMQLFFGDVRAESLGLGSGQTVANVDITTVSGAEQAIGIIDAALDEINTSRSRIGAFSNRMEDTTRNLGVAIENLNAAYSRIADADIAVESTRRAMADLLLQSNVSVLSQANNLRNQMFLGLLP